MSRQVRKNRSSRYSHRSRKFSDAQPFDGPMRTWSTGTANDVILATFNSEADMLWSRNSSILPQAHCQERVFAVLPDHGRLDTRRDCFVFEQLEAGALCRVEKL